MGMDNWIEDQQEASDNLRDIANAASTASKATKSGDNVTSSTTSIDDDHHEPDMGIDYVN